MHPELLPQTTLVAYWPRPSPPDVLDLRGELAAYGQVDVLALRDTAEHDPSAVPREPDDPDWLLALDHPAANAPVFVWVGAIERPSFVVEADVLDGTTEERRSYRNARWQVALQHTLDALDPAASYHLLLKLAVLLVPDLPALFDPQAILLRTGTAVRRLAGNRTPPPAHALYRIHAVVQGPEAGAENTGWVHTHGLERTGLPDLELIDVPVAQMLAAGKLVNLLVACCLGDPDLVAGDSPIEVVDGYPVAFRSLAEVAGGLPAAKDASLLSAARRTDHMGHRLVIVDPDAPLEPPLACLAALSAGATVAGGSARETRRMARRARDAWPEFGMTFARHRTNPDYDFLVQLGYPVASGKADEREHLWFEVLAIAPDRVRARLIDTPVALAGMQPGDTAWHDLALLSDWSIRRPGGPRGPQDV